MPLRCLLEQGGDSFDAGSKSSLIDFLHHDLKSAQSGDLRNPGTHNAGADDADAANLRRGIHRQLLGQLARLFVLEK